jgi:uncharacterized membrane protein YjgN (DUF898 family)
LQQDFIMATVQYHGSLGKIYGIWLSNLLLTIVTLGIYGFWGRKRMRQYLASQVTLNGDPMEYQGTVAEHVIGTIKYLVAIGLLYWVNLQIFPQEIKEISAQPTLSTKEFIGSIVLNLVYIYIVSIFIFTSRCYRINRVTWRGVYHRLDGNMWRYAFLRLYALLGKFFTLGLLAPRLDTKWASWTYSRLSFGNHTAHLLPYSPSKQLRRTNLVTILLALPTLFASRLWYHAAFYREFLGHITVAGVLVDSSRITSGRLISLLMGNAALQIFSLGLAQPIVIDRSLRWLTENITFDGELANDIGSSPRLSLSSEMPPFFIA